MAASLADMRRDDRLKRRKGEPVPVDTATRKELSGGIAPSKGGGNQAVSRDQLTNSASQADFSKPTGDTEAGTIGTRTAQGAQSGGLVGGIVGAGVGVLEAGQKRKAKLRSIESEKIREEGRIKVETGKGSNNALKSIIDSLRAALI